MNIIIVEFENRGKQYYYHSPFALPLRTKVVVNVGGNLKVVTIVGYADEDTIEFSGPLKTIEGVVYTIEDLEQPIASEKPTIFQTLVKTLELVRG